MDSKLTIKFGEDKRKSKLLSSKIENKKIRHKYKDMKIKKNSKTKYSGSLLNETIVQEAKAPNVVNEFNNSFLTLALRHLLYNALLYPNFDYE